MKTALAIFGWVVAMPILYVSWTSGAPSGPSCGGGKTMASIQAREFVRQTLRSPSTASFPQRGKVTNHSGCTFTVRGPVDAQNGFGATVREYYSVTIRYDAKRDTWHRS